MTPAAKINGSEWRLDSEKIIYELGYEAITDEKVRLVYDARVRVLQRPESIPQFSEPSVDLATSTQIFLRFFRPIPAARDKQN